MAIDGKLLKEHLIACEILGCHDYECTCSGTEDSQLIVLDEGVLVMSGVKTLNFIGEDVIAEDSNIPNQVNIYIPPPVYLSHWNTDDGSNGSQYVTETISRSTQRIATPSGGEGDPFRTNGWDGTNQDASLTTTNTSTTPGDTTGFGGDSTMVVRVKNASGTVIDSYTTPAITGNDVHTSPSGRIEVTITSYGTDTNKFKAHASVEVDIGGVFTDVSETGGRYHIEVDHITDSTTDGGQTFSYTQEDVFLDTNETTPSIGGDVSIQERVGFVYTKHLSGIEYYILNSQFQASVDDIDQLMRNTARTSGNLIIEAADYGLATLSHSPFGTGSSYFTGWSNNHDVNDVDWAITSWAITQSNYRFIGTTGNASAYPRDGWANGSSVPGPNDSILVDTYGVNSTNTYEPFDDEDRRQESDYTTAWDSEASLVTGEALVQNSRLMVPNQSTYVGESSAGNANWTDFLPDLNGTNPDYTSLSVGTGVSYYRTFPDTAGTYRPNMTLTFSGTFKSSDALTDLENEDLEIYVRKVAGIGNFGKTSPPLMVHGDAYNAGLFDDGDTNGQIRLGSSSGNTIQCTFGTFTMKDGIYMEIKLKDNAIKINSLTVVFN